MLYQRLTSKRNARGSEFISNCFSEVTKNSSRKLGLKISKEEELGWCTTPTPCLILVTPPVRALLLTVLQGSSKVAP
jgi:hypothetical protein